MGRMVVVEGKSVYNGVAIGKVFVYKKAEKIIKKEIITDTAAEIVRLPLPWQLQNAQLLQQYLL